MKNIRLILYVGPLSYGGTCLQRLYAFEDLGFSVQRINTDGSSNFLLGLIFRIWKKFFFASWCLYINRKVVAALRVAKLDMVWIDKGLIIYPETILKVKAIWPNALIVSYSPDDMMNPNNQTLAYMNSIPYYDYHITTKSYNVNELSQLGAKEVIMIDNAYCSRSHFPVNLSRNEKLRLGGPVGFIGGWEVERDEYMRFLAENDVPIRVWGGWKKSKQYPSKMFVEGRVAWGDDYARTVSAFEINLCFLRKENRDLQTTRSIEIPACGGFMLAERTEEHLSLFKEGVEAEFFDSKEELLSKVKYYLNHDVQRRNIAMAGWRRCIQDGYSNKDRLDKLINTILN